MNKTKSAFTIIELAITLTIIAIIITAISYNYFNVQQKTKTERNYYYANEVIQAIERFKGLNTTGSRYPLKNSAKNGVIDQDSDFMDMLSAHNRDNLSFSDLPDANNPDRIYIETCIRSDGSDNIPVGATIHYWDFVKKEIKVLKVGKTDQTGLYSCF